jgi:dihydropteroate synthase
MQIRNQNFLWGRKTYVMGILNVTPDSFSDGGLFNSLERAIAQAKKMVEAGATIIDIGGQSSRPGAVEISVDEELHRVLPVIKTLREDSQLDTIPISIDTTRATVAEQAIALGADIVNDISGGTFDQEMLRIVSDLNVPIVLMHMRGKPQNMQSLTDYTDVVAEVYQFLETQIKRAIAAGIHQDQIIIDPGIGFAKNYEQNIEIIRNLTVFKTLNCPILMGLSRKSFIGHILNQPDPKERLYGTISACVSAIALGADIVRVHDVPEMVDACKVADAIWR